MICLREWETNNEIYVDPKAIVSMRRISESAVSFPGEEPKVYAERTRIDTEKDMFLVQETPSEVMSLTHLDKKV